MNSKLLSIFVDESGVLDKSDPSSRFYIISLVLHDQTLAIAEQAHRLDRELDAVGISNLYFHAGPIIHAHDQFVYMNWDLRRRIFYRMLAFANRTPFRYACLTVDKRFVNDTEAIVRRLERQLALLMDTHRSDLAVFQGIKIYYDCGQKTVTTLLHRCFESWGNIPVEFAQAVKVSSYKLLQVADLICTVRLMAMKLEHGLPLSKSEMKFFGGVRQFKHNVLRVIRRKSIGL